MDSNNKNVSSKEEINPKQEYRGCNKVITGEQFQSYIRREIPTMSEPSLELVTQYAIKGSRRKSREAEAARSTVIDYKYDLIQFKHFEMAIFDVIQAMKREQIKVNQAE